MAEIIEYKVSDSTRKKAKYNGRFVYHADLSDRTEQDVTDLKKTNISENVML